MSPCPVRRAALALALSVAYGGVAAASSVLGDSGAASTPGWPSRP